MRATRTTLVFAVLTAALVVAVVLGVSIGPVQVPLLDTAQVLLAKLGAMAMPDSEHVLVIDRIRLPRVLVGAFVGAGLGVAGAIMQAMFRNPLADPSVTGVSSGAALAAVLLIITGATGLGPWVLPAGAFVGALSALALVYAIATIRRDTSIATLLLIGIALSALLGAVVSALILNATDDGELRGILFWLNGDLVARDWGHVAMVAGPVLLGVLATMMFARDLNLLLLGEAQAQAGGVNVVWTRRILLVLAAILTGAAVAVAGIIGFAGLVVPHLVRLAIGPDHRTLLPGAALLGAAFLVFADLIARSLFSPVVLQTGTVTAFVGAPAFLLLVLRRRAGGAATRTGA